MKPPYIGNLNGLHHGTWIKWKGRTGVYCITNLKSGKKYVGSASSCLMRRMKEHRMALRYNRHKNKHLQSAWNKYGEDSFVVEVLIFCVPDECITNEQKWIDKLKSADRRYGYNSMAKAGSVRGLKHSEQTKKRLRKLAKEQWSSMSESRYKEVCKNMVREMSPESRRKISEASKGRKHSKATIKKMSMIQKEIGHKNSTPEHKAKLRAAWVERKARGPSEKEIAGWELSAAKNKGKKRSKEYCDLMRRLNTGKKMSPESVKKMVATLTGRKLSDAHRKAISDGHAKRRKKLKRKPK